MGHGSESESCLLKRCRAGDAEAWNELFDLHYTAAARFIATLGSDFSPEDIEEVCQETFLSVIRNLKSFAGQSKFQTWLFRIAANKSRDFRERQHAAKRGGGQLPISLQAEDPDGRQLMDLPSTSSGPDAELLHSEQMVLLQTALDKLGDPCREIIELRYFGDLSYEEISSALNLNVKTVSSRLSKCLDRLEEIARDVLSGGAGPCFPSKLPKD